MNRLFQNVEPQTEEGKKIQTTITIYCIVWLVFGILKMFVPADSGFIDILGAAVMYLSNQSINHIFVTYIIVLTLGPIITIISTLGLHLQTGVSMFDEIYLFRTSIYIIGLALYGVGMLTLI